MLVEVGKGVGKQGDGGFTGGGRGLVLSVMGVKK